MLLILLRSRSLGIIRAEQVYLFLETMVISTVLNALNVLQIVMLC